ncbi:hypothetical protein GCM10011393_19210 [Sphingopyxis bauzanensis]|nr:hypothetical protein GCM10011393_19210 [Sphingopyxis bauzanensis]
MLAASPAYIPASAVVALAQRDWGGLAQIIAAMSVKDTQAETIQPRRGLRVIANIRL